MGITAFSPILRSALSRGARLSFPVLLQEYRVCRTDCLPVFFDSFSEDLPQHADGFPHFLFLHIRIIQNQNVPVIFPLLDAQF